MAGPGCLCQPRGILSLWTSCRGSIGFLGAVERKRPLDWNTSGCLCASFSALCHDKLYRLGKTGNLFSVAKHSHFSSLVAQKLEGEKNKVDFRFQI